MNKSQALGYRALRRVQRFVTELKLGAETKLAALVALFLAQLAQVDLHIQEQESASREAHMLTGQLGEQLRALVADWLRPIARGARMFFGRGAAALDQFQLPPDSAGMEKVLAAAVAMADAAAGIESRFVEHGMAPDFVAQLRTAVDAIRETADRRDRALERRGGATIGLRTAMAKARETIGFLNALLVVELRDEPHRLGEWRQAMRIAEVPGARREKEDAPPDAATGEAKAAVVAPVAVPAVAPAVSVAPTEVVAPSTGEAVA